MINGGEKHSIRFKLLRLRFHTTDRIVALQISPRIESVSTTWLRIIAEHIGAFFTPLDIFINPLCYAIRSDANSEALRSGADFPALSEALFTSPVREVSIYQ